MINFDACKFGKITSLLKYVCLFIFQIEAQYKYFIDDFSAFVVVYSDVGLLINEHFQWVSAGFFSQSW